MKKLILACVAACTMFGSSAQIIRSTTSERSFTKNEPVTQPKKFSNYGHFTISYDHMSFGFNKDAGGSENNFGTNGVGLNFIKGYNISKAIPLYLEWGINGSFGFYSDSETEGDYKATLKYRHLSFGVPVNVAYRAEVAKNLFVKPYIGINFRVNALFDGCTVLEEDGEKLDYEGNGEWNSLFDDDGEYESPWKRFQMGWQIGAGLEYGALYFGLQYGTDFIPAAKEDDARVSSGTFKLMLGVSF